MSSKEEPVSSRATSASPVYVWDHVLTDQENRILANLLGDCYTYGLDWPTQEEVNAALAKACDEDPNTSGCESP